jgi:hypothetical protein
MKQERKTRSDAVLNRLTEEQRDRVFTQCEPMALEGAVRWLKAEFYVTISPGRLSKWLAQERTERNFMARMEAMRESSRRAGYVAQQVGDAQEMTESNIALLSQALFDAQCSGDRKEMKAAAFNLSMVIEAMAKDRKSKADALSAETGRDKFQFDAAKSALKHAAELQTINQSAGSEREKVDRAVERLFGRRPERAAA